MHFGAGSLTSFACHQASKSTGFAQAVMPKYQRANGGNGPPSHASEDPPRPRCGRKWRLNGGSRVLHGVTWAGGHGKLDKAPSNESAVAVATKTKPSCFLRDGERRQGHDSRQALEFKGRSGVRKLQHDEIPSLKTRSW